MGSTADDVVDKIWTVITVGDQWTKVTKTILDNLCIEGDGVREENSDQNVLDLAELHPYVVADIPLPHAKVRIALTSHLALNSETPKLTKRDQQTGYVYLLVSTVDLDRSVLQA